MDMYTGDMVDEGMAVGIVAAQSIGEPGTQLTMRTFHLGGVASLAGTEENEKKCKRAGKVKLTRMRYVTNQKGESVVLNRTGEISILDPRGRELETHKVPTGAILNVTDEGEVKAGDVLCHWNPFAIPLLCEVEGKIRFEDIIDGETVKEETDASGQVRRSVIDFRGDAHPQLILEDAEDSSITRDVYYLPERAHILVQDGQTVSAGTTIAETPREASGVSDITGGLPRVTEIFEARKPKDPAVLAHIDGEVEILKEKKRGKRTIMVKNAETGIEKEHLVPPGKRFRVHSGDYVTAGQQLVDGPLVPHDILLVSGEEAVQHYLLREIQSVYRSQRVEINDKHIEIIVSRMLRKAKVETAGDTNLLPGMVLDRFDFLAANQELAQSLKITNAGDSSFEVGVIVPKAILEEENARIEVAGGTPAKGKKPTSATYSTQLLGITKASVQSKSFISAASFQETTKVLTEAALAGKVDNLVGLKENVILGHLIPAGTGFHTFQQSEVQYNLQAMREIAEKPVQSLETSFPLLDSGNDAGAATSVSQMASPTEFSSLAELTGDAGPTDGLLAGGSTATHEAAPTYDDLTVVEGIGPKIQEAMFSNGITTWSGLAGTSPDRINALLMANGLTGHDPTTWPDQSRMAAEGRWDELKVWQQQLNGGVGGGPATGGSAPSYDDLTVVEGIGPKIQEILFQNGITTWAGLGAADAGQINQLLTANGLPGHDPTTWPQQSQMAADGRWDELKAWQDQLDGGKPGAPAPGSTDTAAPAAAPVPTPAPAPAEPTYEDLTIVEGIGPKGQELLFQNGITTWAALGQADPQKIREILEANGMGAHDPTTWPRQAQMAAEGRWDELKVWQDELDGGKVVTPTIEAKDDLTTIEGIGPKGQELLYDAGIMTWAALGQADPEKIREILAANGMGAHDPTTWPKQAQMAAEGRWDELKVWQDELDGGKVVAPAAETKEELTKIEGIGPKVQEILYSAGITTFAGLAGADPADISGVLEENGLGMHQPQTWPQQAALARDGKWDELATLQDELDGGKPNV